MIVYANSTLTTEHGGRMVQTSTGEAWAADDPFVTARPELFGPDPREPRRTVPKRKTGTETTAKRGPSSSRITGR